jgi:DNA-binding NarL/FixJ family response regulator
MSIRVMIFEDNHGLRIGLAELIDTAPGFQCVGAFPDGRDLVAHVEANRPDVVLMDIGMPGIDGIEAVRILREHFPDIRVLMQTVFEEDSKIFASILAGASGYLLKNTPSTRILDAIRELHEGGAPMSPSIASKVLKMVVRQPAGSGADPFNLSDREKDILGCLVRGMSYKLIADACHISIDTVRSHIRSIYDKLHVHSKGEAIAKAINRRIV